MSRSNKAKTISIGLFTLIGIGLVVGLIFFLKPKIGDGRQLLHVRFSSIYQIAIGTRVTFAGKPIGRVSRIEEIFDARDMPTDSLGRVYYYELTLAVDSHVQVYTSDEITLHTSGLLGERSIVIIPHHLTADQVVRRVGPEDILYAKSDDPVQATMATLTAVADKMSHTMDAVTQLIDSNNTEISSTIKAVRMAVEDLGLSLKRAKEVDLVGSVQQMSQELEKTLELLGRHLEELDRQGASRSLAATLENLAGITEALNQPESLKMTLDNLCTVSKQTKELIGDLHQSWPEVTGALRAFEQSATHISQLTQHLAQGKSSLGKLLTSDELYLNVMASVDKTRTVLNDVNHYGLLFHLDQDWRKQRLQRIYRLHQLESPSQFQQYFEQEMAGLTTSSDRLAAVLQKMEAQPTSVPLKNPAFQQQFSDLLRRLQDLEETLQLYNQQSIDAAH